MANRWNVDKIMQLILIAVAVVLTILLLNYLSGALFPFGVAFLIAYIVNPIVDFLHKKMRYRILAVLTVLLAVAAIISVALWIFIPKIVDEIQLLGALMSRTFQDAEWSKRIMVFVPDDIWVAVKEYVSWEKISGMMMSMDFWNALQSVATKLISGSIGVLSGSAVVVYWISEVTFVFIYLVFLMLDFPRLATKVYDFIPKKFQSNVRGFATEMNRFMGTYFRSQTIVACIVGILFATAFSIIGFPMGITFGLFIGVLNMVPYLQLVSIPVALLLGVAYSLNMEIPFWQVALILTGIYSAIQLLQDLVLTPNIIGKSMNLPPAGILLSLSIWGTLLGFLGLVVAIPFTCMCLVYARKVSEKGNEYMERDAKVEGWKP